MADPDKEPYTGETTHDVKAELDVSAVHDAISKSEDLIKNSLSNADSVYVNNLETGFRTTFTMDDDLNGEFYKPASLKDAEAHYVLYSAEKYDKDEAYAKKGDDKPLIYRINYEKSKFDKKKITLVMDLDLTKMHEIENKYSGDKVGKEHLYGQSGVMENFHHSEEEHNSTYNTSTFGNLKQLILSSTKKMSLVLKDVLFHSATGNPTTVSDTDTETITTTEGTLHGTLVGYMKADAGHGRVKANVSYVWGAIKDPSLQEENDDIAVTVKFNKTTEKQKDPTEPVKPADPAEPEKPAEPDQPVEPEKTVEPAKPDTKPDTDAKADPSEKKDDKKTVTPSHSGSSSGGSGNVTHNIHAVKPVTDTEKQSKVQNKAVTVTDQKDTVSDVPSRVLGDVRDHENGKDTETDPGDVLGAFRNRSNGSDAENNIAGAAVLPKTGDTSRAGLWSMLSLTSLGMFAAGIFSGKKRKTE